MTIRNKAYIAGTFEHPTRLAPDKTVPQLHAECAAGAIADAGLSLRDVDGYLCAFGGLSMVDYLGLDVRHIDDTETVGSSYILHVSHAAQAIAAGHCSVALITLADKPRWNDAEAECWRRRWSRAWADRAYARNRGRPRASRIRSRQLKGYALFPERSAISSVWTSNPARRAGPKVVVSAVSVASRPRAIRMRPIRGVL